MHARNAAGEMPWSAFSPPLTVSRGGEELLAKLYLDEPTAATFLSQAQAEQAAARLGHGWTVGRQGRFFHVAKARGKFRERPMKYGEYATEAYNSNSAERHEMAKRWMREHADEYVDARTGEMNHTGLAEGAAHAVGETHWLSDEHHPVWDWAIDVFESPRRRPNVGYEPNISTPWGKSDSSKKIAPGFLVVGTPGHGGFAFTPQFAEKHLSDAALKRAQRYSGRYFYEEDIAWAIPAWELKQYWPTIFAHAPDVTDPALYLHQTLSAWYPDYLEERGIAPEPTRHAKWQERKASDRMRAERHPDLVVAAQNTDVPGVVYVWTADDQRHLVTAESYDREHGQRLSRMDVIRRDIPEQHPSQVKHA